MKALGPSPASPPTAWRWEQQIEQVLEDQVSVGWVATPYWARPCLPVPFRVGFRSLRLEGRGQ